MVGGYENDSGTFHLIDFGCAEKIIDAEGFHLPETNVDTFKGTLAYASLNSLFGKSKIVF